MLYGHMRRDLLAAALFATACASSSAPPNPASPTEPAPADPTSNPEGWSCFGMKFNLGYDGLHTSLCQKTREKCEAIAESLAKGEGEKILVPTTGCARQPYAYCYVAYGKAGEEIVQCTRNELECSASQELQGLLGSKVGSSCQLATQEPLTAADYRWFCFNAAGPSGGSALCEPARVACEATRAQLTGGELDVSACEPLEGGLAYCAAFGAGNAMCTPSEESCIALRTSMAPSLHVPVADCKPTKATCSSSAEDGAHCAKPAQ